MTKQVLPAMRGFHGGLDLLLRPGVHIGGGLVQDQHGAVQKHGPGDGQKLPLALGNAGAVVLENCVIALGQGP